MKDRLLRDLVKKAFPARGQKDLLASRKLAQYLVDHADEILNESPDFGPEFWASVGLTPDGRVLK